jgi:hypothetical protein
MVMMVSFTTFQPGQSKIAALGIFTAIAVGSLLLGLWLSRFAKWQRDVGIVLLVSSSFVIFLVIIMALLLSNPEGFQKQYPEETKALLGNVTIGIGLVFLVFGASGVLLWQHRKKKLKTTQGHGNSGVQ